MRRSFIDARVLLPLVGQLRRDRPSILHAHLLRANLYGRIAARLAGVPVTICTLRNVEDYFTATTLTSRAVRAGERLSLPLVDRYVAVSEGVRQAAITRLGIPEDRIVTILNAVHLEPFRALSSLQAERAARRAAWGVPADDVVIGTTGSLDERKNQRLLINLVAELHRRGHRVHLIVAGDGPARLKLEGQARELGIEAQVRFVGFRRDVPALLGAVDLFAMTSRNEGLPRAAMEAMAAGLPCVVTNVGGNAEAVIHGVTGFVAEVNDQPGLLTALEALVTRRELRLRMGSAGRARAFSAFDPARLASQYESLYEALLERANRRPR